MTDTANIPAPTGRTFGYARVSTSRQNLDRQMDTLRKMGVDGDRIYADKVTGRTMDRPAWQVCNSHLDAGDTLVVDALDRLGRSTLEVIDTIHDLTERGVIIVDRTYRRLDASDAVGKALVQIMAVMAEMEVNLKAERAAAARESAAARGKHTGRPRKLANHDVARARELKEKGLSAAEIGKSLGVSRATVFRYLADETRAPQA
ncbi:Resolvase domain-containing protein [Rhodococcus rhodochrous ATCC 21198]|nr:Resolvase domain-containing protein [Rhodococcus rhodochrous ATCC 21198]